MGKYYKQYFNNTGLLTIPQIHYKNLKEGELINLCTGEVVRVVKKDILGKNYCCRQSGVDKILNMPTYTHCHLLNFLEEWHNENNLYNECMAVCGPYMFEYVTKIVNIED